MPQIPQYESRRQLTTEAPFIKKSAELEAQAGIGGILKGAGELISDVTAKFNEVRNFNQESDFNIETTGALAELEDAINKNPDLNHSLDNLDNDIRTIGDKAIAKIIDPKLKTQLKSKYDLHSIVFKQNIKNAVMKAQIKESGIKADREAIYIAENNFSPTAKEDIENIYKKQVELGVLFPEEAQSKIDTALEKNRLGKVKYHIFTNPQFALDELSRGKNGIFPDLTPLERTEFMKDAQGEIDKQIAEVSRQQLITYATNEDMVRDRDISGQPLTIDEIESLRDQKLIRAPFALSKIKSLKSAKAVSAVTDIRTFEEIFGNIVRRDISATEIREKIYNKNAEGRLSLSDVKRLLFAEKGEGITTVYEDFIQEQEELKKIKKETQPKRNFWGSVKDIVFTSNMDSSSRIRGIGNVIDRVQKENAQGEQIIPIAKDEARKQILIDKPEIAKLPKEGFLHRDKFGNTAIVYPDGTYEEVMKSTGEFRHKEQRKKVEVEVE